MSEGPIRLNGNGEYVPLTADEVVERQKDADAAANAIAGPPDNPTLGDWRVALTLWGRMDDVTNRVAALVSSAKPDQQKLGKIASERLNYSNNVLRAQLLQLKDAFGFSAADVDESLWRAQRVSLGDLSGTWPLPVSK
jgi:hypothetical protein